MSQVLAKYIKSPEDKKRYSIEYERWLDEGETISSASFTISPDNASDFAIDDSQIAASQTRVSFFVDGGNDGETYSVYVKVNTSGGQTKVITIVFSIIL